MFEVDRRSRAVIRAGRGDHCGVAPTAALFRQHLGSERVQRRAPIAAQAMFEIIIRVIYDNMFGLWCRLRHDITLPIGLCDTTHGVHVNRIGRYQTESSTHLTPAGPT